MKRIIIFTHLRLWSMGSKKGAPSFHKTVIAYRDAGWDVHLISPMSIDDVSVDVPGISAHRIHLPLESWLKFPRFGFFIRLTRTLLGAAQQFFHGLFLLRRNRRHTVLYAYEVYGALAAKALSLAFRVPVVTRFQGTIMAPYANTFCNRVKRYPHIDALATKADIVIMTDDGTQGDQVLSKFGNESPVRHFWRNGVDKPEVISTSDTDRSALRSKLGIPEGAPVLLTLSRLARWKRVDRAIYALAALDEQWAETRLVVVGDGPEQRALSLLAQQKGVEDRVVFVGAIPREEIVEYFECADIFLSLYDLSNLGNPLFEAMFYSLPIITLDVGDTREVISHGFNGVLLGSPEIENIAAAVEGLLSDREYATELGRNAERYASEKFWTWEERMGAELASVDSLLD